ncbi:GntR family transcriptional regulator [Flagellimonas sp. DF-77]|uniref:GntR family transcriptional regulator n=1 Tax=Flagellimonas algarum TaxID=3230298 RepID=UPI0033924A94
MQLVDFIIQLEDVNALSKHERLVLGIMEAIDAGNLPIGSQLPSINSMVEELGFARKTIVKAYEELKDRGLVESKKTKGYFVVSNETKVFLKIALLMYSFQRFQQEFYNTLREQLGEKVQIDVFFHHNNMDVFETIFLNIRGKYGMYVIAPIEADPVKGLLSTIPPEKLVVVDRYIALGDAYTYITQEFEQSTYVNLSGLLPKIKKYSEVILFFRNDLDYPEGILKSFVRFCEDHGLTFKVEKAYRANSVKKGTSYLFISDSDLWLLLKDCRNSDYRIGKDVGVLSFNDHIVKEIVSGGITTISTDFDRMAATTAEHIRNIKAVNTVVPTTLIERDSL